MTTQSKPADAEPERQEPSQSESTCSGITRALEQGKTGLEQTHQGIQWGLRQVQRIGVRGSLLLAALLLAVITLKPRLIPSFIEHYTTSSQSVYPPLAMAGGDPYVRALMRTISSSESNDSQPYALLYGGTHFSDLNNHPDRCVEIVAGPNRGDCTTAAGRYQFITSTWAEKARLYHPHPDGWFFWQRYPFDPVSQDQVVYGWLTDVDAWGMDIPTQLKNGRLSDVLYTLSGTWTSLGYGIETNEMTPYLDEMYQRFLKEELKLARSQSELLAQPLVPAVITQDSSSAGY